MPDAARPTTFRLADLARVARLAGCALAGAAAMGCGTPPPRSPVPSVRSALDRVHATQDCGVGVQGSAKIDHFGKGGRVRGDLLLFALWPARLQMDVVGPMNVGVVATLTSDGTRFALLDQRDKRFLFGPASSCNIARLTTVPMPGHVLVSLMRGEAPVLKHEPRDATIGWSKRGYYVLRIPSTRSAYEEIHLAPHPADFDKPWQEQRMRVLEVEVKQEDVVLYHAVLDGHAPAAMAKPRLDPENIDPPIPPSGPVCHAELPRRVHVEVPGRDEDVLFRYEDITWNPPLIDGLFTQSPPPGIEVVPVTCKE